MNEEIVSTPLDGHFAALMLRLNGSPNADLERAARAVSAWRGAGHTCLPLAEIGGESIASQLRECAVVGAPGEAKPLILDDAGRLYLQRYWAYEAELATAIRQRLSRADCDEALLAKGLARLFPKTKKTDGQRIAAETAVRKNFCVITGGPGTGKTYTVARVLALLAEQFAAAGQPARIALAAPTGKAAARLQEALAHSVATMPAAEPLRQMLPGEARTIHRLLGTIPDSPYFRHDRTHLLAVDVVVIDEASMVDLALMAKLFAAVPDAARVILIGDKDQLASVEAGNVLGDICGTGSARATAPIAAHIVELTKAHRFAADSGIQRASALVNAGEPDALVELLRDRTRVDLLCAPTPPGRTVEAKLRPVALAGFRAFLECTEAAAALARLGDFRILCATRRGPHGVENLNLLTERTLAAEGLIAPESTHYHGRPVLVRTNDYPLRLFNGDVGLILRDPAAGGELRAFFPDANGAVRRVLPARLPAHETSFAMTVHQSQGSEFPRVLLVLPDRDAPILTRELLYTGLTRARSAVEIWADEALLRAAIGRRTQRSSGLRDALWNG
jgi:exodeoxyribonuclease V alpha subunit